MSFRAVPRCWEEDDDNDDEDNDNDNDNDDNDDECLASSPPPSAAATLLSASRYTKWSTQEDAKLSNLVKQYNSRNWAKVASHFSSPARTDSQCFNRWQKVLRPDMNKGPWTAAEDAALRQLMEEAGPAALAANARVSWTKLSHSLPGRNGKQARERWFNHLDPAVDKRQFTEEEDRIILREYLRVGTKWSVITRLLPPGRTDNAVKNHFNASMKSRLRGVTDFEQGWAALKNRKKHKPSAVAVTAAVTVSVSALVAAAEAAAAAAVLAEEEEDDRDLPPLDNDVGARQWTTPERNPPPPSAAAAAHSSTSSSCTTATSIATSSVSSSYSSSSSYADVLLITSPSLFNTAQHHYPHLFTPYSMFSENAILLPMPMTAASPPPPPPPPTIFSSSSSYSLMQQQQPLSVVAAARWSPTTMTTSPVPPPVLVTPPAGTPPSTTALNYHTTTTTSSSINRAEEEEEDWLGLGTTTTSSLPPLRPPSPPPFASSQPRVTFETPTKQTPRRRQLQQHRRRKF